MRLKDIPLNFIDFAHQFREKALARHAVDCYGGFNFSYYLEMSQLYIIKKLYCEAEEFINIAINMCMQVALTWHSELYFNKMNKGGKCVRHETVLYCQVPKAWTTLGHLRYLMNDYENAACCFERRISYGSEDSDLHYVYLRLGASLIYMSKVCYITAQIQT